MQEKLFVGYHRSRSMVSLKKRWRKCLAKVDEVLISERLIPFLHFDICKTVAWQQWWQIGKVPK